MTGYVQVRGMEMQECEWCWQWRFIEDFLSDRDVCEECIESQEAAWRERADRTLGAGG